MSDPVLYRRQSKKRPGPLLAAKDIKEVREDRAQFFAKQQESERVVETIRGGGKIRQRVAIR